MKYIQLIIACALCLLLLISCQPDPQQGDVGAMSQTAQIAPDGTREPANGSSSEDDRAIELPIDRF